MVDVCLLDDVRVDSRTALGSGLWRGPSPDRPLAGTGPYRARPLEDGLDGLSRRLPRAAAARPADGRRLTRVRTDLVTHHGWAVNRLTRIAADLRRSWLVGTVRDRPDTCQLKDRITLSDRGFLE